MEKNEILIGLYNYLLENIPRTAFQIIEQNDIRVENFFAIHSGVYLNSLLQNGHINSFSFQHTILLQNPRRIHIDIKFSDSNNHITYLELKHFSISQNRGNRRISFYTSNSIEGKKVGIIGDCEKLDRLRNNGLIENNANCVCLAFVTPKPNINEIESMENRFINFPELLDWTLNYPIPLNNQNNNLGLITLQK